MIDELDLALVDGLRVDPRVPWPRLALPLGVDPATLSRRWARLAAAGDAWVASYPSADRLGVGLTALVSVECRANEVLAVGARVAADPEAVTVEVVTGRGDLRITVAALDSAQATSYVLDRLCAVPGVLRTRTALVERTLREGSSWRDGALDRGQVEALGEPGEGGPSAGDAADGAPQAPSVRGVATDWALMRALGADGRMPYVELAKRTGLPATTVRRRIAELRRAGKLVLRCDTSPGLSGHRTGTTLWLNVPAQELPGVTRWLSAQPQTRMCALVAGAPANVAVSLMTHLPGDVRSLEAEFGRRFPAARVVERELTLRTLKLVGRLLNEEGRAVGYVPIGPVDLGTVR